MNDHSHLPPPGNIVSLQELSSSLSKLLLVSRTKSSWSGASSFLGILIRSSFLLAIIAGVSSVSEAVLESSQGQSSCLLSVIIAPSPGVGGLLGETWGHDCKQQHNQDLNKIVFEAVTKKIFRSEWLGLEGYCGYQRARKMSLLLKAVYLPSLSWDK